MSEMIESDLLIQLQQAAAGNEACWRQLLEEHNGRLRRMVAVRLDPRLQGRLDPSDVLQETYLEATRQLQSYLSQPALPFHLWLRGLAGNRLNKLHRRHLGASKRDAGLEKSLNGSVPEASSIVLAAQLMGHGDSPSEAAHRADLQTRLAETLDRLDPLDREALVLRHFEQLSSADVGQVLGISEAAASKRYLRALERLRLLLADAPGGLDAWRPR
jgi:RNA polymerase sigma-70 factor, ECF subfamily